MSTTSRREQLTEWGKGLLKLGAVGVVGSILAQPGRVESASPADTFSERDVATLKLVIADWDAKHSVAAPVVKATENKPARMLALTELKTPQQVFDAIFVPVDPNYPNARNLVIGEIQPDLTPEGKQVGWRISRAKNQLEGAPTYIPAFRVNLPRQVGMQWGFLADYGQRKSMGLSEAEAKAIGLNPDAKYAGVPCDMDLYVEGLAISWDQSMFYGKLPLQTAWDRMNNPH